MKNGYKFKMIATRNYEDRVSKGKVYNGTVNGDSVEFTCNQGIQRTSINLSSLLDGSWFIEQRELPKNIKVL